MSRTLSGPLSLNLRSTQSPPPISIQSASGEVLRLKRVRRISSAEQDNSNDDGIRPDKVAAVTVADLHAYYATVGSPHGAGGGSGTTGGVAGAATGGGGGATIALPAAGSWSQADLEQATTIGGQF